jgi:hypothetical protein
LRARLERIQLFLYNTRMRNAFVLTALIALSLGLSGCSKCDSYRFWTGPKACSNSQAG